MAQRREIAAVYTAAVIQGIVLVTFPAVSSVFTSASHYGLSTTEYGCMFVPQAITAILASFLGARVTRHIGGKRAFLLGLAADLLSMALLFVSQFATGDHLLAYGILLAATACMGVGFGFVVPALNTFAAAFFPKNVDRAVLALNALLGLGTALAPVLAVMFVGLGVWWGLPILMSGLTLALLLSSLGLPLEQRRDSHHHGRAQGIEVPARFWIYAAFALVYGICETMNANWATVHASKDLGASSTLASMTLTVFWVTVTGGRVLFAAIEKWCPAPWVYRALPILLAVAFLATAWTPKAHPLFAIIFFGVAGLGCSALLPLVISFGQRELTSMTASVAGGMIGSYQMGYGVAAFGVGPLRTWAKLTLASIYGWTALFAFGLAVLAFFIVAGTKPPRRESSDPPVSRSRYRCCRRARRYPRRG